MDPIWKELPRDLVDKICNMLPKVRRVNHIIADQIVNQWYKYDKYYYRCMSFFGNAAHTVMYDDMKVVFGIVDDFPEEIAMEVVVQEMWKRLSFEQRCYLFYMY